MPSSDITQLIAAWRKGNRDAEAKLFDALYATLHETAVMCLRHERPGHSLGATALVHEAYLRFRSSHRIDISDREHFLALASRVMRRILVDRARLRIANKRAGEAAPEYLAEQLVRDDREAEEIIGVDRALDALAVQAPQQCRLVELRYFAGYSVDEAAAIVGVSSRTARRMWQVARVRLAEAIDGARV
jgi:RNA polymerase sigma factor (TIGR02999 family)